MLIYRYIKVFLSFRLLPMLKSKCREAKSMAAFHFTMEATIKKDQQKLEVFQVIFTFLINFMI